MKLHHARLGRLLVISPTPIIASRAITTEKGRKNAFQGKHG
jgi:hypothetical protein